MYSSRAISKALIKRQAGNGVDNACNGGTLLALNSHHLESLAKGTGRRGEGMSDTSAPSICLELKRQPHALWILFPVNAHL